MQTKTNYHTLKIILGSFLISVFVLSPFGEMIVFADESSSINSTVGTTGTIGGQRIIIDTLAPDPEQIETRSGPVNTGSGNENITSGENSNNPSSVVGGVVGGGGSSSSSTFADNPYVVIQATKVICRNPQDLPRGHDGPNITRNTATEFVAAHPNCWFGWDWDFQWGFGEKSNPVLGPGGIHGIPGYFIGEANGSFGAGTNTGTGYNDWKTFGSTNVRGVARVEISNLEHAGKIWVREVQKSGYIPFVGEILQDNRPSAQMWCHDDVLTYDNFDFVRDPVIGGTYYCVAFNAIDPSVASPTVTLTANPREIQLNGSSTLTWATENATSCSSSEFNTNGSASGSVLVTPQIVSGQSFTYNIYCSNAFELAGSASITITVASPISPGGGGNATTTSPTSTLVANPAEIQVGGSSTLTWTSQNTVSCSSSEFNTGNAINGSSVVSPDIAAGQSKIYRITCLNSAGISAISEAVISTTPVATGGGSGGGGGSRNRKSPSDRRTGEVLGVETTNEIEVRSCSYIRDFMKMDWENNSIEVMKLQSFLGTFEKLDVSATGVFDQQTSAAVGVFQEKYKTEILSPWGYTEATNFVYITTRKKINEIYCNTIIPLTPADVSEIDNFRNHFLQAQFTADYIEKNTPVPISSSSVIESKTVSVVISSSLPEILPENIPPPAYNVLDTLKDNSIGHPPNNLVWNFIKRLFQSKDT